MIPQCQNCVFWDKKKPLQYAGNCLNPNNYRIRPAYDFWCNNHKFDNQYPMFMQSQVRD